jgi:hypothetical protein
MTVSTVANRLAGCLLQKAARQLICCVIGWLGPFVQAGGKRSQIVAINRCSSPAVHVC